MKIGSFILSEKDLKYPRCLYERKDDEDKTTFYPNPKTVWRQGMTAVVLEIFSVSVKHKTSSGTNIIMPASTEKWCKVITDSGTVGWIDHMWICEM